MKPTREYRFNCCLMLVYDDRKILDTLFYEDGTVSRWNVQAWHDADPEYCENGARIDS